MTGLLILVMSCRHCALLALLAPRWVGGVTATSRRRSRKFSRKFVKKSYFANFSDAPDARGRRELPLVKISALNDPWRYQKRQKNEKKNRNFLWFGTQFFVILIDFGGARLFLMSKSSSSRFFALDGQIFRSVRRLGLIFRFFTVRTSTCGEIYGEGPVAPTCQQVSEPGQPTRAFLVTGLEGLEALCAVYTP